MILFQMQSILWQRNSLVVLGLDPHRAAACRAAGDRPLSLSETQFAWQVSSNRVMLLPYERCLQLDLVGAGRIVPIASVVGS